MMPPHDADPNLIWRCLPYTLGPADHALAYGEALLAGLVATPQPAVRWYGASQPALVLGSGQRPALEADPGAAAAALTTIHKRASGGGAVLFVPGFVMQDVVLPTAHPLRRDDVSESYRWLGDVWVTALAQFGLRASLVSIAEARADTATLNPLLRRVCYGGRSPYEVVVDGRKLVGLAQTRRRPGALFQVGLYRTWPGAALTELLRLTPAERTSLTAALAERVVGLDELLDPVPSAEAIMAAFATALHTQHGVRLAPSAWRDDEHAAAQAVRGRFAALEVPVR